MTEPPVIVLDELEGHAPAGQHAALQGALAPHVDVLVTVGWVVWFAILAVMVYRQVIAPLIARARARD